ncbi:MAG: hypothetical protein O3C62_10665 [Actinomycetota bacterium]|nr:hypothetical protein [Actinomycetota bacterium]MDA2970667.1 hypothetical protein [Actinomycetota bacterium]MDA3002128.1 hypothetical protein [Actinomycetota bacterium]
MASLNCPVCDRWSVDVNDHTWRVTARAADACIVDPCERPDLVPSERLWADLDLVSARSEEWRDRGVYDPMPPPPDPPNSAVVVRCSCGVETVFDRQPG